MRYQPPEGWVEVWSGVCLEGDVLQAVLESYGLKPVTQRFSPQVLWSGSVFEDCRIYVPTDQAEEARKVLADHD